MNAGATCRVARLYEDLWWEEGGSRVVPSELVEWTDPGMFFLLYPIERDGEFYAEDPWYLQIGMETIAKNLARISPAEALYRDGPQDYVIRGALSALVDPRVRDAARRPRRARCREVVAEPHRGPKRRITHRTAARGVRQPARLDESVEIERGPRRIVQRRGGSVAAHAVGVAVERVVGGSAVVEHQQPGPEAGVHVDIVRRAELVPGVASYTSPSKAYAVQSVAGVVVVVAGTSSCPGGLAVSSQPVSAVHRTSRDLIQKELERYTLAP